MDKKIELLAPAGSMPNLKAAVSKGADAVYLGLQKFNAREFATNFNEKYFEEALRICKSNNVKLYLTLNTLIKNHELKDFFSQLEYGYTQGIDAVIIQEISFIEFIKKNFPDLRVHISTQAGTINSAQANCLRNADRINLARELSKSEISEIKKNFSKELEVFVHGALCVCISGSCLFSSFLGGRSGNRGKCAQPCRKKYNGKYLLSTKELCLIKKLPEIIHLKIDSLKIEGRMRTPFYVATATEAYRKAIDSYYAGQFEVSSETMKKMESAFSREFTEGKFSGEEVFNWKSSGGKSKIPETETYEVKVDEKLRIGRIKEKIKINLSIPEFKPKKSEGKKLLVRVYNRKDAIDACRNGADVIYYDLFDKDFPELKSELKKEKCKLFAATPRIMLDKDIDLILDKIKELKPNGLLAGNLGMLNLGLTMPMHLDYNLNCFNDFDVDFFEKRNALPIVSPELSIAEVASFKNKNFAAFVHGKIKLMTLRHDIPEGIITDEKGGKFVVNKIWNGSEIINNKELGLLSKTQLLMSRGINQFYIDTDKNTGNIVKFYRNVLDGKKVDDSGIKKNYVLGWSFRGVL